MTRNAREFDRGANFEGRLCQREIMWIGLSLSMSHDQRVGVRRVPPRYLLSAIDDQLVMQKR